MAIVSENASSANDVPGWDPKLVAPFEPFRDAKFLILSDSSVLFTERKKDESKANSRFRDPAKKSEVLAKLLVMRGIYQDPNRKYDQGKKCSLWEKHAEHGYIKALERAIQESRRKKDVFSFESRKLSLSKGLKDRPPKVLHLHHGGNSLYNENHVYQGLSNQGNHVRIEARPSSGESGWTRILALSENFDYVVLFPVVWSDSPMTAKQDMATMMRFAQPYGFITCWAMCQEMERFEIKSFGESHFIGGRDSHVEALARVFDVGIVTTEAIHPFHCLGYPRRQILNKLAEFAGAPFLQDNFLRNQHLDDETERVIEEPAAELFVISFGCDTKEQAALELDLTKNLSPTELMKDDIFKSTAFRMAMMRNGLESSTGANDPVPLG